MPTQQQGDENPGFDERSKATGDGASEAGSHSEAESTTGPLSRPTCSPSDGIFTSSKSKTLMHRIFTRAHSRFH